MTDLATALRHELDRLPRFGRSRFVHADRLEPLLTAHDDQIARLVRMAATARGVPDDVIRLEVGLDPQEPRP